MLRLWLKNFYKQVFFMNEQGSSLFLELLRSAIWNKPADEALFQETGPGVWSDIISFAESQKVNALIYDGIMNLPVEVRPERKTLYKLFLQTETIEKLNDRINNTLKQLSAEYEKIDCPFVLLKGQGNGTLYPNPKHRTPGDIDVFLYRKEDYKKANNWAKRQGFKMDKENIHHHAFDVNGVLIENHKTISYFGIRKYDVLFEEKVQDIVRNHRFMEQEIDNLKVNVLPVEFNAFFLFYHLFHHFIDLGVGVRQLSDWILFMHTHSQKMDKKELIGLAEQFDLLKAMEIFASAAVKYMGANADVFPFTIDTKERLTDVVMNDVLRGGNFGFLPFENRVFRGKWDAKWHRFRYSAARTKKISGIAPRHINTLPIIKITNNLKLLFKK